MSTKSIYATYLELKSLCNSLDAELARQKKRFEEAMHTLQTLTKELFEMDKLPNPDSNDLSQSTVDFVSYAANNITLLKEIRVQEFNNAATDLHQIWKHIKFTPSDEIEQALVDQFILLDGNCLNTTNSSNSMKLNWYSPHQPPLTLSSECVEAMKQKQRRFNQILVERKQRHASLTKRISRLYKELGTLECKKKHFPVNYEESALAEMESEHGRLREILMVNLDQLIEDYKLKLTEYWEKCEINKDEQGFAMLRIMEGVDKEERADIIREELIQLEDLYNKCHPIFSAMQERRELIHKMIQFEKTASDPRRLFRSSFQLNQEEKWRKTAYPNLLKFEELLINAILEYELEENKPFVHNNQRYMDVLEREIAERPVCLTVFGFGNGTPVKARNASYSGASSIRGTCGNVNRPSSPSRSTVTPRRPTSTILRTTTRSVSRTSNIDERRSSVSSNDSGDSIHTPLQASNIDDHSYHHSSINLNNVAFEMQTPRTRFKSGSTATLPRYRNISSPPPLPSTPGRTLGSIEQKTIRKPAVATLFGDTIKVASSPTTPRAGPPRSTRKPTLLSKYQ
ncbi:hypothetical protein K7432_006407 [Basidiobolus ranarum]